MVMFQRVVYLTFNILLVSSGCSAFAEDVFAPSQGGGLNTEALQAEFERLAASEDSVFNHKEAGNAPESLDWREHGYATRVKNQQYYCQSCYIFSALGAIEGALWMQRQNTTYDLSEQNVLDCAKYNGCSTGFMFDVYRYVLDNGVAYSNEYEYFYNGVQNPVCYAGLVPYNRKIFIKGFQIVQQGDEEALKRAIATVGPVSVAMNTATQAYSNYKPGEIIDTVECEPYSHKSNHAVLAVGYGSENGKDYWLLKNSYGEQWGDKGYFKVARNKKNMCAVASFGSFPLLFAFS